MRSAVWHPAIATIIILPFLYLEETIDPVITPRFIFLAAAVLVSITLLIIKTLRDRDTQSILVTRRAIVLFMLGYMIISGISITNSTCISEGIFDLLKILLAILFFMSVTTIMNDDRKFKRMIPNLVILVSLGLSLVAVLQYFKLGFEWIPGHHIPYATMANKNLLASLLFISMPFAFYGACVYKDAWRVVSVCSIILSLYTILIGQTRAVWAALAFATLFSLIMLLLMKRRKRMADVIGLRKAIIGVAVVVLVFLVSILTLLAAKKDMDQTQLFNTSDASLNQRLLLWQKTITMYMDHPILGTGLSDWKIELPQYGTEGLPSESGVLLFQRPHNDFLWILSESGPAALACYLMVFGMALYYSRRIVKNADEEKDIVMALCLFFGIAGFAVISFFSYPKERIAHAVYFMLILSVITARYHNLFPPERKTSDKNRMPALLISAICLIFCLTIGVYRLKAEIYTKRAVQAISLQNWRAAVDKVDKARSIFVDLDPTATPLLWYKGAALYMLGDKPGAFNNYLQAYQYNPNHVQLLNNLASCYEEKGDHTQALDFYKKALAIAPVFEKTLINMAAVYYNNGEYQAAYDMLMRVKGEPTDPRYDHFLQTIKGALENEQKD